MGQPESERLIQRFEVRRPSWTLRLAGSMIAEDGRYASRSARPGDNKDLARQYLGLAGGVRAP